MMTSFMNNLLWCRVRERERERERTARRNDLKMVPMFERNKNKIKNEDEVKKTR